MTFQAGLQLYQEAILLMETEMLCPIFLFLEGCERQGRGQKCLWHKAYVKALLENTLFYIYAIKFSMINLTWPENELYLIYF